MLFSPVEQRRQAARVQSAHTSQMTCQMPICNEIAEHCLIDSRILKIGSKSEAKKIVDQRRREHNVAEAQGREQGLAKRSDEDHIRAIIKALQSRHRLSFKPILAVIVILD